MADTHSSLFRVYVLQLTGKGMNKKKERQYRIAYGVVSSIPLTNSSLFISGGEDLNGAYSSYTLRGYIVTVIAHPDVIDNIVEGLLNEKTLKTLLHDYGFNVDQLKFDVSFNQQHYEYPTGIDESINENVVYSQIYELEEKTSVVEAFDAPNTDKDKALDNTLKWLETSTALPFKTDYKEHVGNLEYLSQPDRDMKGRASISISWDKDNKVQTIVIDKALANKYTSFFFNIRTRTEGIITEDCVLHEVPTGGDLVINRPFTKVYDGIQIKVWGEDANGCRLIYFKSYHLIKNIQINANVESNHVVLKTKWLKDARKNTPKQHVGQIDDAAKITHTATEVINIGERSYTPLLSQRHRKPVKTNDVFFPTGWNSDKRVFGRIAFLDWFKNKTKGTEQVFLQDPYFEDVALEFIAESACSGSYTVLTQTKLKTNPDGTSAVSSDKGDKRGERIIRFIKNTPTLFHGIKLVIKDVNSASNALHDRYLFFYYNDGHIEAYTLSNSLQGATQKYPLLITQIGDNAFRDVERHVEEVIKQPYVDVLYNYEDEIKSKKPVGEDEEIIADKDIFLALTHNGEYLPEEKDQAEYISELLKDNFSRGFATLGYYLADIPDEKAGKLLKSIAEPCTRKFDFANALKTFLMDSLVKDFPIGYVKSSMRSSWDNNLGGVFEMDYSSIVNALYPFDFWGTDGISNRVWGIFFASKLLIRYYPLQTKDILVFLQNKYKETNGDRAYLPIGKLCNVFLHLLFFHAAYIEHYCYLKCLLEDKSEILKAFGSVLLIYNVDKRYSVLEDYKHYLSAEQAIELCNVALRFSRNQEVKKFYYSWLRELFRRLPHEKVIKTISDRMEICNWGSQLKMDYVKNVFIPLTTGDDPLLKTDVSQEALTKVLFIKTLDADISVFRILAYIVSTMGIRPVQLINSVNSYLNKQQKTKNAAAINDDDHLFNMAKPLAELRALLNDICNQISGKKYAWESELQTICSKINDFLKSIGYEMQWSSYEYWQKK